MDKKGQGLSINAIILIVLGLAVLVVLILGFMLGWNKIVPWFGEKNNIDTISKACQTACGSENLYNYCSVKREVGDGSETYKGVTCYTLGVLDEFDSYGINSCNSLSCNVKCADWSYINPKGETILVKDISGGKYSSFCQI